MLCLHVAPLNPLPETWLSLTHAHICMHARTYVPSWLIHICHFLRIKYRFFFFSKIDIIIDGQCFLHVFSFLPSMSNIERHHSEMIMMTVKAMINFLFYQIWHFAASGSFYYQFHSPMSRDLFLFYFPNTILHFLSCFLISNIHC